MSIANGGEEFKKTPIGGIPDAGCDGYVMKIETGNGEHYDFIEAPGTMAERIAAICYAEHLCRCGILFRQGNWGN
ncbi:MAG TPA: hypothetical protein VG146_15695 [Verrucomicrobiae bacterium]|nr:hypothetical protein [Verrucomicrobiae bacterium]